MSTLSASTPLSSAPKSREGGIELLRSLLMLFIIGHHTMVHGVGLFDANHMVGITWVKLSLNSIFVVAVDTFIFISGYFGIRLRTMSVIKLQLQIWAYAIVLGLGFVLAGLAHWNATVQWSIFFPTSTNLWWFLTTYMLLMLVSPVLNLAHNLEKKAYAILLLLLLFLNSIAGVFWIPTSFWGNSGYALMNFITIYLLAGFLKRHHVEHGRLFYLSIFVASSIAIYGVAYYYIQTSQAQWVFPRAFAYNSPLLILSAFSIFMFFKSFKFKAKWIFFFSPLVLGVYLLHDHPFVRSVLYTKILGLPALKDSAWFFVAMPAIQVGIFLFGSIIEWGRSKLSSKLEKRIANTKLIKEIDLVLSGSISK